MVNSCCTPLDLLCNKFINNVYADPDNNQYNCPVCGKDKSKELASTIVTTLREKATNLPFSRVVRLRASFWTLVNRYHGYHPLFSFFNIVEVVESTSGILATVRTIYGERQELAVSEKDFLEMVEDPSNKGDIEHNNDDNEDDSEDDNEGDIEHGNDDNEDNNDHDSEDDYLPSLEEIFGLPNKERIARKERCRAGDSTSVEQPTEVTRNDIGPRKLSRESNRQGTQTVNARSSTVIQGARTRKRSQLSSEPAIFPNDGATLKRPRRATKETVKAREAREGLETMRN